MNAELLMGLFRLAGLMCLGLIVANFLAAPRLGYARNLEKSEMIVRQIFYVHCGYIVFLIAGLAVLCLGWPEMLLTGGMGRIVCLFFGVFWGSRVIVQLTYYDRELRKQERFWDMFFLGVFLALAVIFTMGGFVK